jgi:hypothetical protein
MAGKQFKSMDIWELLAHRAEIDALIRKKRKELERAPRTSRTTARVVTRTRTAAKPKARRKKAARSRRTARAA